MRRAALWARRASMILDDSVVRPDDVRYDPNRWDDGPRSSKSSESSWRMGYVYNQLQIGDYFSGGHGDDWEYTDYIAFQHDFKREALRYFLVWEQEAPTRADRSRAVQQRILRRIALAYAVVHLLGLPPKDMETGSMRFYRLYTF